MNNIIATAGYTAGDFSRDSNGNPTAHYEAWINDETIHSTKRRAQIGYNGYSHAAAERCIREAVWAKYGRDVNLFHDPRQHPHWYDTRSIRVNINRSEWNEYQFLAVRAVHVDQFKAMPEYAERRDVGLMNETLVRLAGLVRTDRLTPCQRTGKTHLLSTVGDYEEEQRILEMIKQRLNTIEFF